MCHLSHSVYKISSPSSMFAGVFDKSVFYSSIYSLFSQGFRGGQNVEKQLFLSDMIFLPPKNRGRYTPAFRSDTGGGSASAPLRII